MVYLIKNIRYIYIYTCVYTHTHTHTHEVLGMQSCPTLCDPLDYSHAPLSMEFSRQEYWGGLPFPPPGDLPHPGVEPESPKLQADSLPSEPPGKPQYIYTHNKIRLSHKKEWNNAIYSNMDGSRDYHSKWRIIKTEKDKYHDITYMWNLKKLYKWTYL